MDFFMLLSYFLGLLSLSVSIVSCQYVSFSSSDFNIKLDNSSQTLASLSPKILPTFDFSPFDVLANRSANGNYHLGDVTLRYRNVGDTSWITLDSAANRAAVQSIAVSGSAFLSSNLSPTLPANPLNITRTWGHDGADITLSVTILNTATNTIELGSFGFPIEFNSIFTDRTAVDTQAKCSLTDPNIGLDGGYLRITPLAGTKPALVVTPLGQTPFEAWRFLPENDDTSLDYQSQVFEGFYSWEVFSKAYTENEWKSTTPWNPGTSRIIAAGQPITMGLRFSIAPDIQSIESTVKKTNTPLAIGSPGYIIPRDMDSTLRIYHSASITSITETPTGALNISALGPNIYKLTPASTAWGRVRVAILHSDNKTNVVSYYITKSAPEAISNLGNFLTTSQWFIDTSDPFSRAPSVITYDRSTNTQLLQDPRAWMAGLSDEGGAGSWLAACMKQSLQPNAAEITKLEQFISKVMWGVLQQPDYSVRKSVFYYQPNAINYTYSTTIDWSSWTSWNKAAAYATDRAYDYVHVTAGYWALYRVARAYPELFTVHNWNWYLNQAYQTVNYMLSQNIPYSDVGLMGETVFGSLLQDLKREGNATPAGSLEGLLKARALVWDNEAVPFGSEMAWDSTGQEGVYYWSNYFNLTATASKTISSILGYTPITAHWGWNGNARRYWDNLYGGALRRIERQIHHYGSALNSLPLLQQFMHQPTLTYLLRLGYAGNTAPLSNIDQEGFASASFHSWPDTLAWDAYSGDYGPGFLGLTLGTGCYVTNDTDLGGIIAFGGNLEGERKVYPRDAGRKKVYLGWLGVLIEVDAGAVESVGWDESGNVEVLVVSSVPGLVGGVEASSAVLWVERKTSVGKVPTVTGALENERGGWKVDLSAGAVVVNITMT